MIIGSTRTISTITRTLGKVWRENFHLQRIHQPASPFVLRAQVGHSRYNVSASGSGESDTNRIHRGAPLDIPNESLHAFLFKQMEKYADDACLIDKSTETSHTFNQVLSLSKSLSVGLRNAGMSSGDVILFYKNNSTDFATMALGAIAAGGVVAPVNPASTVYELKRYLKQVNPMFIFTETGLLSTLEDARQETNFKGQIITNDGQRGSYQSTMSLMSSGPSGFTDMDTAIDTEKSPAIVLFSSGTTGFPKGVMLTHKNVLAFLLMAQHAFPPDKAISLNVFPVYHMGGLVGCLFRGLMSGTAHVMYPKFDFIQYLEDIQAYKPHALFIPPPLVVLMTKSPLLDQYDLTSVRYIITGAATVKKEVEEEFGKRFNNSIVAQVYALTEGGAPLSNTWQAYKIRPGSVGKPTPGNEIKVVNPDTGNTVAPNENGEVLVRSDATMLGYLNDRNATNDILDQNGWIHTGDMGYYDDDGYFYIVDRYKELIKYKAYQVSPAELEDVILKHPDVADTAVIGLPDNEAGELPCAYVVKRPGSDVTDTQIIDFVTEHVSHYKRLRGGVRFVDAIPKLASGKILRRVLRETAQEG